MLSFSLEVFGIKNERSSFSSPQTFAKSWEIVNQIKGLIEPFWFDWNSLAYVYHLKNLNSINSSFYLFVDVLKMAWFQCLWDVFLFSIFYKLYFQ